MSEQKPDPNCECKGRGWFTLDMMGSAFVACKKCNTHEVVITKHGDQVFESVRLKQQ